MASRIEELIDDIEGYIEGCKFQAFSNTKIIVDKDELSVLISELRKRTPQEIKTYAKVIANRDEILNAAKEKAEELVNKATVHTNELINEHEIMQQAYAQANEVVALASRQAQELLDNATAEANMVKMSAMQYTDEMLLTVENIITHALDVSAHHYNGLYESLTNANDVVKANRAELNSAEDILEEIEAEIDQNLDLM